MRCCHHPPAQPRLVGSQPSAVSARVAQQYARRQCSARAQQRGEQQTCSAASAIEAATLPPLGVAFTELPAPSCPQFIHRNTVFTEEFRIRGNEAGPDQRTNIICIANLMQEVGGNHGVALWGRAESGFAAMPGMDHLIFVATRMQIRMLAYPKWGDIVRLETYFAEDGRLASRRDWRIIDVATGELLGAATSTWVTINSQTRRLAKLPDGVRGRFLQLASDGYVLPKKDTRKKLPDFVRSDAFAGPLQVARRSDMDPNGHINNTTYLTWAMETLPQEVLDDYHMKEVEVDFKAECHAGDEVECLCMPLPQDPSAVSGLAAKQQIQLLHSLIKRTPEGGQEVWRARTTFIPRHLVCSGDNGGLLMPYANSNGNGHASSSGNGHANSNGNGNGKHTYW